MNILIVYGSPHKNGTTDALAKAFRSNLDSQKHTVSEVWLQEQEIKPCLGCDYCKSHDGACVRQDDMEKWYPALLAAELVVFVTPLYYFGFSAQMKTFIDRFYALNTRLRAQNEKKAILLTAGGGKEEWIMDGLRANYRTMLCYLHWESLGEVCAYGCHRKEDLQNTPYPSEAEALGKSL